MGFRRSLVCWVQIETVAKLGHIAAMFSTHLNRKHGILEQECTPQAAAVSQMVSGIRKQLPKHLCCGQISDIAGGFWTVY